MQQALRGRFEVKTNSEQAQTIILTQLQGGYKLQYVAEIV